MGSDPDVIVVGGGPAGSSAAIHLARAGRRVLLFEKAQFPRPKLCGGFLGPDGIAELERIGVLPELLQKGARPLRRLVVASPQGTIAQTPLPTAAISVSREILDDLLLSMAQRAGVEIRFGVDGFTESNGYPDATLVIAAGRQTSYRDRSVEKEWPASNTCFGIQAIFENVQGIDDQVELDLLNSGYVGLARLDGPRVNICALTTRSALVRGGAPDLDAVLNDWRKENSVLARHLREARRVTDWMSVGPVRVGLHRLSGPRRIYVGDAAYVVDPFAGEGMSYALYSSRLATQALGQSDRPAADVYAELWHKAFRSGLRWDGVLRAALGPNIFREPVLRALREFPGQLRWLADATRPRPTAAS